MKNYYQILNVRPNATDEEIKRSYRVLAKRYHPDVNPGDSAAADKFADINEANEVLSDAKARAEYDAKLKESTSARLNPEDVIARQRQQAQAAARQAARQAAFRANMNANMGASAAARRDAVINKARQAAQAQAMRQAAQAQAMRNAAHAQAQAQAQAQMRDAQMQAQVQAIRNQAYQSGKEQGMAEAKAAAEAEITKLNASVKTLTDENKKLKKKAEADLDLKIQLSEAERDRRELEQELFNRDRELSQEKLHAKDIEDRLNALQAEESTSAAAVRNAERECDKLREMLDKAQLCIKKLEQDKKRLEQEKTQADLRNQAQLQLQQDKRRMMQEEIDELNRQVDTLTVEVDELRTENEQWQQYAKSEEFLTDAERRLDDWNKKTQADRRLAKPTLYGVLGVLIWATEAEIDEAYAKLYKRYAGKTDESIVAKLAKVEEAYETLSDPQKRAKYNKTIDISPERIATERKLIAENESLMEEYRNRLAGKEFWAHYDETQAAALSGDANAQNTLGEMYYYGDEIERDLEQAVFWFKEGAKQKHAESMYNLGICFVNGEGIERNEATGEGFIRQAAKLGSKLAKQYMSAKSSSASGSGSKKSGKTVDKL